MKRIALMILVVVTLLVAVGSAPASAVPRYGSRHTANNGFIVWVRNDAQWSRVRCTWFAGRSWTLNWRLSPREYNWTTSDAGNWGDRRPQNLECTYRRI